MTLELITHGQIPPQFDSQKYLEQFCQMQGLDLHFEWINNQYWLHSDLKNERPIGINIDQELERHLHYFKKSSLHKEVLARAIGIKGSFRPELIDLTAGLLGDSLLFLSMGCKVTAVERHPVVGLLIESALKNAQHPLLSQFQFHFQTAQTFLSTRPKADVIFFDPMFEDSNDKAAPKKEMRIFRNLVGTDQDARDVFKMAYSLHPKRLVIKRPRHSIPLFEEQKALEYLGKSTRYDVYLSHET